MSSFKIPDDEYPPVSKSKKMFTMISYARLINPRLCASNTHEGNFTEMLDLLHTDNYHFTKVQENRYKRSLELIEKYALPQFKYFSIGSSEMSSGTKYKYTCVAFSDWSQPIRVVWYFHKTNTTNTNLLYVNGMCYDLSYKVSYLSPPLEKQLKEIRTTSLETHEVSSSKKHEAFPSSSITLDLS